MDGLIATVTPRADGEISAEEAASGVAYRLPLLELDVVEVTGHNLEARARDEVNRLLAEDWRLLHIYTLWYQKDDVWRERPMPILGPLRSHQRPRPMPEGNGPRIGEPRDT
jgi:hypothetical protein